ncbi:hypothetical protein OF83DRAFT_147625 [Amylostereum chailletii]|nr:hypothetical protein OF83DRAFT_147625 [Amylostereum chailletii]
MPSFCSSAPASYYNMCRGRLLRFTCRAPFSLSLPVQGTLDWIFVQSHHAWRRFITAILAFFSPLPATFTPKAQEPGPTIYTSQAPTLSTSFVQSSSFTTRERSDAPGHSWDPGAERLRSAEEGTRTAEHDAPAPAPSYITPGVQQYVPTQGEAGRTDGQDVERLIVPAVKIKPMDQHEVNRYQRNIDVRSGANADLVNIKPFKKEYKDDDIDSVWITKIHPEGARYYTRSKPRVYTEADVRNSDIREQIESALSILLAQIQQEEKDLGRRDEIVFEQLKDDSMGNSDAICYGYYIADRGKQVLYWADPHDASASERRVTALGSAAHVGHAITSAYWAHVYMFPTPIHRKHNKAREFLLATLTDILTCAHPLAPWKREDVMTMLQMLDKFTYTESGWLEAPEHILFLARLQSHIEHVKFIHFHGHPGARLNAGQTVHGSSNPRSTILFRALDIFLWGKPAKCLVDLEKHTADNVIILASWQSFMEHERERWKAIGQYCSFLGASNLAFLAIPSVISQLANSGATLFNLNLETRQHLPPHQIEWTWAQTLSFLSLVTLFISAMANFLALEHYSGMRAADVAPVVKFIRVQRSKQGPLNGIEALALWHSFPLAFLIWGGLLSFTSLANWSVSSGIVGIAIIWSFSGALIFLVLALAVSIFGLPAYTQPIWRVCGWMYDRMSLEQRVIRAFSGWKFPPLRKWMERQQNEQDNGLGGQGARDEQGTGAENEMHDLSPRN